MTGASASLMSMLSCNAPVVSFWPLSKSSSNVYEPAQNASVFHEKVNVLPSWVNVPAPFCGRRGCGSYACRGSDYCGPDCERLVREARAGRRSPYAPGFVERVAALLAQKLSLAAIGDALGVNKNVVCGIVHRRQLRPAKPHVVVTVKPAKPKPKRVARPAQPRAPTRRAIQLRAAAEAARVASPIRVCLDTMPGDGCQFPTSENPWRICDSPRVPSSPAATRLSPYCALHVRRAYLKRAA